MDTRRALLLAIALGGATLVWTATRYGRAVEPARAEASETTGEPVTLRFFRNPAAAPQFVARDLDGTRTRRPRRCAARSSSSTSGRRGAVPCRAEIPDLVALQEKYPRPPAGDRHLAGRVAA
jgi:hypothetical protein